MKTSFGAAVMLLSASQAAQAQDVYGVVSLSYGENQFANSGVQMDEFNLQGRVRRQMGNGLSFGLQAGTEQTYAAATTGNELSNQSLGGDVSYGLGNGTSVGAFAEESRISGSGLTLLSTSAIGLTAGYADAGYSVKGFLGSSMVENAPSVDITAMGANASYAVTPEFTFGASLSQHSVSSGSSSNTISTYGIAAVYQATPAFGLHGGMTQIDSAQGTSVTEMGLGASYNVNAGGQMPILGTLELIGNSYASTATSYSVDTVRLGVTLPIGPAARKVSVPIHSVTDKVFQPIHNVIGTFGESLF